VRIRDNNSQTEGGSRSEETMIYEYIQVGFDWGDLSKINSLSSIGWKVVHVERLPNHTAQEPPLMALMERGR
jgi:hypothetical protein